MAAKNKGVVNKQDILKADIDYAIQQSETMEQYISTMKQMGYEMKQHYSYKEKRSFITYSMNEGDGKVFRRRDRRLGSGYRFDEIVQRVKTKDGIRTYEDILEQLNRKAEPYLRSTMLKGSRTFYRLYQAVNYYRLPNPFVVPSAQVRKDMVRLDKLLEDCRYLKEHQLPDAAALKQKRQFLQEKMEELKSERKTYYRIKDMMRPEDGELLEEYRALARQLMSVEQTHSDRFEEIEDRMEEIKVYFHMIIWKQKTEWLQLIRNLKDKEREWSDRPFTWNRNCRASTRYYSRKIVSTGIRYKKGGGDKICV